SANVSAEAVSSDERVAEIAGDTHVTPCEGERANCSLTDGRAVRRHYAMSEWVYASRSLSEGAGLMAVGARFESLGRHVVDLDDARSRGPLYCRFGRIDDVLRGLDNV